MAKHMCPNCGHYYDIGEAHTCYVTLRTASIGLLDNRGKTHGDYAQMSDTIQRIKAAMRTNNWETMRPGQREALELIATKIGRIIVGDPNHHDHWADISGYAQKGLESCR